MKMLKPYIHPQLKCCLLDTTVFMQNSDVPFSRDKETVDSDKSRDEVSGLWDTDW